VADPIVSKMPDGQMFYSITYGKNAMGSYASQISSKQRWMIIDYIKAQRGNKAGNTKPTTSIDSASGTKVVNKDSTATNKLKTKK
jgi:hypothetical protein